MEPARVPKSFGCFPHKGLKLGGLQRLGSKSTSTASSPRSPLSPVTPKSSSREDELRQVFRRFDGDSDGKISALELRAYFASIGEYMSHEEAQGVIDELDMDGDNSIDFQDFLRLMKMEGEDDDLKAAFEMFEFQKGSGRITPKSLQRVLSRLGDSKSYDDCVAMIQVYDTDGSGELDFHEFHQMMA
uniref:EF-hand domain-containing protein n=1 Tax=Davidia involucrata TaxID=16924 RepID=A0A5B6YYQ6_DAVIN